MTVSELIKVLKTMPLDATVLTSGVKVGLITRTPWPEEAAKGIKRVDYVDLLFGQPTAYTIVTENKYRRDRTK